MFSRKNVKNIYALSPMQEAMLFHALYDESSSAHFEQSFYHISGDLDVQAFEKAWNEVVRRHDILRTIFVHKNVPQPLQIVLKERRVVFHFEDIHQLNPESREAHCRSYIDKDRKNAFDLGKDMLLRLAVFKCGESSFNVLRTFHHILIDGWSNAVIEEESHRIYQALKNGDAPDLTPPVPFSHYIKWLKTQDSEAARAFWESYLSCYRRSVSVPSIHRIELTEYIADAFEFQIDGKATRALEQIAADSNVTLNTVVQAIWGLLLSQYNQTDDVVFGAVVSGRPPDINGIESMVGLLINLVPVRVRFPRVPHRSPAFRDLVEAVYRDSINAAKYHHYSLAKIQAQTTLKRDLLNHVLVFENYPVDDLIHRFQEQGGNNFVIDKFEHFDHTNYDLTVLITPLDGLHFNIRFNRAVYDRSIIEKIEDHIRKIVREVTRNQETRLEDLGILSDEEKQTYRQINEQNQKAQASDETTASSIPSPPENERQKILAGIWENTLGISPVGIDDDFIKSGGHSISAIQIVSEIHKAFEVEIDLKEFFDHLTIRSLDRLIRQKDSVQFEDIQVLPPAPSYDVSHAQRRLWILDRMEENFTAYNLSGAYLLEGSFDPHSFKKAFTAIIDRHESLRTTIVDINGKPRQKINPCGFLKIEEIDLQQEKNARKMAESYARKDAQKHFDLSKGPLIRVSLLKLAKQEYVLVLTIHHIICDGWSLQILENELLMLYYASAEKRPVELPPLKVQYRDYTAWHNRLLEHDNMRVHRNYWHEKLSGNLPILNLPADAPRPAVQAYRGNTIHTVFDRNISLGYQALARQKGASLFMSLVAGIKILLYRYTNQNDLIIGFPIAGRNHPDLENQIGFFVNILPLRTKIYSEDTFLTVLENIRRNTTEAYEHQIYPFDKLVEELDIQRDVSRSPIFDVMVVLQAERRDLQAPESMHAKPFEYDAGISQYDITFNFMKNEGALYLSVNYNTDLFREDTIRRFITHIETLMDSVLHHPDLAIKSLNILPEEEKHRILFDFNDNAVSWPKDKTIIDLFEQQVCRTPDNPALIFEDKCLTYTELNELANGLACELTRRFDIQPDDIVGVLTPRDERMIIALMGILKAGGAYLPIDPSFPKKRIDFMIEDSHCKVLLTDENHGNYSVDCLAFHYTKAISNPSRKIDNHLPAPRCLAYVIYTSGSTGNPKGVMVENGGFVNMTLAQIDGFGVQESDRVLQFASPSFDASLSEVFMALLKGAALVLISRETIDDIDRFIEYIQQHQVSVITFPPVYLNMLNRHPLPTVRTIITAGEPAVSEDVMLYNRTKQFFNAYGPTETSVCTSFYKTDPSRVYTGNIPVGRPIANSSVYICNEDLQIQPIGVPGEICFSGPGVARGYLNRSELTEKKFIKDPFYDGRRMYRIGDLGRWLPDGNIQFLGRIDDQVKIRGYRVEPSEIRNQICRHESIEDALVSAVESKDGTTQLAAYIITPHRLSVQELRQFLGISLPQFMIPSHFIQLKAFPLTSSGKIDKKALQKISEKAADDQDAQFVAPRNDLEKQIVGVWESLFGKKRIGVHDNYFVMGGDSIRAIQMVSELGRMNLKIRARDIFQHQTVAELAKVAVSGTQPPDQDTVSGPVPFTPVSRWFFDNFGPETRHYFNHAMVLRSAHRYEETGLKIALSRLQEHHDVLRTRYTFTGNGSKAQSIVQEIRGSDYPFSFQTFDLTNLASHKAVSAMRTHTDQIQTSFDLATGPLMKAALFHLKDGDRLFLVVHHLVMDRVSWSIFMQDLSDTYQQYLSGQTIQLPPKTASFKHWAEAVEAYSTSESLIEEIDYWQAIEDMRPADLPEDKYSSNALMKDVDTVSFSLSSEDTGKLSEIVRPRLGAGTEDVLLAALARAMRQWHGRSRTAITLEGHGREDIGIDLDVSRTVGWFTSTFPVILETSDRPDAGRQIEKIRSIRAQIPNNGIGYGILKYITPAENKKNMRFRWSPDINFNYLGHYREDDTGFFEIDPESPGHSVSPDAGIIHDLDIGAVIAGDRLQVIFNYNRAKYRRQTIQALLDGIKQEVKQIIDE